jgi:hypothetical protein
LNWIIRAHVINEETRNIVVHALQNAELDSVLSYPEKHTFSMTSDEGLAILRSPNGAAGAYMLGEHRAIFGIKTIESVTVWAQFDWDDDQDLNDPWLNLYFRVVPYVPPT